jgi:LPXTG-site transpeptidase (sortase) family protein
MFARALHQSHAARRWAVGAASVAAATAAFVPVRTPAAPAVRVAAPVATPVPTPSPSPVPVFRPVRLELPTLKVTAPIVSVGTDADGAMGTPKTAHEVAWWDGIMPGEGNALFAGHKDWNRRPGSFFRIGELKPGDPVVVQGDAVSLAFRVEWVKQVGGDSDGAEILGDAGHPVITLITCGGQFDRRIRHYKDRVVVRAVLA